MENQPTRRRRVLAAEAEALLAEQQASGLTILDFAASRDISPGALHRAKARARESSRPTFVEVKVPQSAPSSAERLELKVPGGLSIEIPNNFHAPALRELLKVLQSC